MDNLTPSQHNELGICHISLKEYDRAEFHFSCSVNMSPLTPVFHHNLGKVFMEQMKPEDAETHLKKAVSLDENFTAAHYDLSLTLGLLGKWTEFFKEYEWRNEYFSDLKYYQNMYSFSRKTLVCKKGLYRSFVTLSDSGMV